MNRFAKPLQTVLLLAALAVLAGCTLGQAAEATPTAVDVNAVMTSAASTAYAQLTELASLATATLAPTQTPAATETQAATATQDANSQPSPTLPPLFQVTATQGVAAGASPTLPGLPAAPTITPVPPVNTGPVCKNAIYIADITIPDGTVFAPWEKFYKVWRMQNSGTCTWDEGFTFKAWSGPPSMTDHVYKLVAGQTVAPGESKDIGIHMYAPGDAGTYVANWSWYDDNGKPFGQSVTVSIKVEK